MALPPTGLHLLVEGLDYAGKSVVAELLRLRLDSMGYAVRINRGGLHRGWAAHCANRIAVRRPIGHYYVNLIYALVPIVDALHYRGAPGTITIQESYVHRMVAYQLTHGIRLLPWLMDRLDQWFWRFDATFLLTACYDVRVKRFQQRVKRNAVDEELIRCPETFQDAERILQRRLSIRPIVQVIDTSVSSSDVIVDQIIVSIAPWLG